LDIIHHKAVKPFPLRNVDNVAGLDTFTTSEIVKAVPTGFSASFSEIEFEVRCKNSEVLLTQLFFCSVWFNTGSFGVEIFLMIC
jgi:hypothetical protein